MNSKRTISLFQLPDIKFPVLARTLTRLRCCWGVQPLSESWNQRGKTTHRFYLEQFLKKNESRIRGRCLEFQEDSYTTRYGKDKVVSLDIINKETGREGTTYVADLTKDNNLPGDYFDCIICTYVLHIVYEKEKAVSELHRILKTEGVLLICVPNITIHYPSYPELWRFTVEGLRKLLCEYFEEAKVDISGYGNSLTAAGELRGLGTKDFSETELNYQDPRFSQVICACAVK